MSLVLTELSNAGVAMVTDSAISMLRNGRIESVDQQGSVKLLKVERIRAGISYWGSIGFITRQRFDHWLQDKIQNGDYTDLPSFAEYLVLELNRSAGDVPLRDEQPAGIHVAGLHPWPDGECRPTFCHIHNGHLTTEVTVQQGANVTVVSAGTQSASPIALNFPTGSGGDINVGDVLRAAQQPGASLRYATRAHQRVLFAAHLDFPPTSLNVNENLDQLARGYLTRNGDYLPFVMIAGAFDMVRLGLNTMPNVSIPRDAERVGSRVGFLHLLMETVIRTYRCSTMQPIIGGHVTTLGIHPDGRYFDHDEFERSAWARHG